MKESNAMEAILPAIDAERAVWLELVGGLPSDQLESRPEGGWSVIDMLFHVASWQENALKVARHQAEPGAPIFDPDQGVAGALGIEVDRFNEEFMAAHRDRSIEEAVAWSGQVNAELKRALQALPAERLLGGMFDHGARRWYWRPAVVHPIEHRSELEVRFGP